MFYYIREFLSYFHLSTDTSYFVEQYMHVHIHIIHNTIIFCYAIQLLHSGFILFIFVL